jgi:hypothetical protein
MRPAPVPTCCHDASFQHLVLGWRCACRHCIGSNRSSICHHHSGLWCLSTGGGGRSKDGGQRRQEIGYTCGQGVSKVFCGGRRMVVRYFKHKLTGMAVEVTRVGAGKKGASRVAWTWHSIPGMVQKWYTRDTGGMGSCKSAARKPQACRFRSHTEAAHLVQVTVLLPQCPRVLLLPSEPRRRHAQARASAMTGGWHICAP